MSEKKSMRFQTRIFLTVICVALVPIILCFTLLLPVMVSTSTKRQSEAAQTQLDVLSGQLTGRVFGHGSACLTRWRKTRGFARRLRKAIRRTRASCMPRWSGRRRMCRK